MARPRKRIDSTGLVAAATRLPDVERNNPGRIVQQQWQADAWGYFDTIGELRFVATWIGNVMSRAELRVVERVDAATDKVLDSGPAVDALEDYFGGEQGQAEMMRASGVHLSVPGECYHVYANGVWQVLSQNEVRKNGSRYQTNVSGRWTDLNLGGSDILIRVWQPHPTKMNEADSPVRSNLAALAEVHRSTQHIEAVLTSRLAGAGLLALPNEITFPIPEDADPNASQADVFMQSLAEAMTTPIVDRANASAVVPLVVTAPGEYLNQIKFLTFWSELSEQARIIREAAVKRLALGMDIPAEILTGMANTNHWNAWLIDEASIKAHIEPRLALVANAVTTGYLRPALAGLEGVDPARFAVVADTSNIRLRPNRSREAIELYDRGALSRVALLRETGFENEDSAEADDVRHALLWKVASASAVDPIMVYEAIKALGVDLPPVPGLGEGPARGGKASDPTLLEHPDRTPPALEAAAFADSFLTACHALVVRALERVGHKITNQTKMIDSDPTTVYLRADIAPTVVGALLDGAWATAPQVLAPFGVDPSATVAVLDAYAHRLVRDKVPHDVAALRRVLVAHRSAAQAV